MPRRRVALSIALAALTVLLGVGLIATSGYLISRAAEQPPILSLTVTIVARPLLRPLAAARPLLSTASSPTIWRCARSATSGRGSTRASSRSRRRSSRASAAAISSAGWSGDVDALQGLYLRGIGPPAAALVVAIVSVAAAALILPAAGLILAVGLLVAGLGVPLLAGALARSTGRRQATARGELTADLVELLRGAPELVLYGREEERLEAVRDGRSRARAPRAPRRPRCGARRGLLVLVAGPDDRRRPRGRRVRHSAGRLDRVLVATVTLLALASFEGVATLPAAAQELTATLRPGAVFSS